MGILSYGYKASKTPVGKKVVETVKNIFTGGKKSGTGEAIKSLSPAENLSKKRAAQDSVIKDREKIFAQYGDNLTAESKKDIRAKANQAAINRKMARIYDRKAKGGRIGYKKGTPNPFARKTKLKKIQEAFKTTPSFMVKKKEDKKRMSAKKGSPDPKKKKKFPDLTGDGKVTFADILKGRGVIKGKKKPKKKII